jgi:hypothetical protein
MLEESFGEPTMLSLINKASGKCEGVYIVVLILKVEHQTVL